MQRSGRNKYFVWFMAVIVFSCVFFFYLKFGVHANYSRIYSDIQLNSRNSAEIIIAAVACGEKLEETLTMIKSALIFSKMSALNFKIVTQDNLRDSFIRRLNTWQKLLAINFSFEIYAVKFPKVEEQTWKTLFKPCAAQRLFLPSLLENVDSTIYVDTDILFLSPPDDVWEHFKHFNSSHIAGLAPEHEDINIGWYSRFARHPFFGKLGVNSGVMLMNLTRMRNFKWEDKISPLYKQYKAYITWGDQDLINILFYFHPDKLYILPCAYNYRPDHCMYMNICNITKGVRILHGNRSYFHTNKQPLFSKIYSICKDFTFGSSPAIKFLELINQALQTPLIRNSSCGQTTFQNNFLDL